MDFRKFKNLSVSINNVDIRINPTIWDKQPTLYSVSCNIDGIPHKIDVVRCGYIGLIFLLVDSQPTVQLYGTKKIILENLNSLGVSDEITSHILKYAEYSD
jgi:hypothetical protein